MEKKPKTPSKSTVIQRIYHLSKSLSMLVDMAQLGEDVPKNIRDTIEIVDAALLEQAFELEELPLINR